MAFLLEFLEAGAVDSSGTPVALGRRVRAAPQGAGGLDHFTMYKSWKSGQSAVTSV